MSEMFSNGTEGTEWMAKWCEMCANDDTDGDPPVFCEDATRIWGSETPDCIILEPEGEFHMPPAHICTRFTPDGVDDLADQRAFVVRHVRTARGLL